MDILNLDLEANSILIKNITDYMKLHDMKPDEFALKCSTSKQQIYMVIGGKTVPKVAFLDRLATGMGITVAELMTEAYFDQFEKKIVKKSK